MESVADLCDPAQLKRLVTTGNFRDGEAIAKAGEVRLTSVKAHEVTANVGGALTQPRNVRLVSTPQGLVSHCSCNKRPQYFCKHAVAAGLISREQATAKS